MSSFPARSEITRALRREASIVRWRVLLRGYALALTVGLLSALLLRNLGDDWGKGYAWERTFMIRLHEMPLPSVLDGIIAVVPWLGTNVTLFPINMIIAAWLVKRRRLDLALVIAVAQIGSTTVNALLKQVGHRARPELWSKRGQYGWQSFPSGHAIATISVLVLLAWLYTRERNSSWPLVVAGIIGTLILYSRLYLGVHWPTDVIVGLAVGGLWLTTILRAFPQARGPSAQRADATVSVPPVFS